MLCIQYPTTNAFFNVAAEEYFLTQFKENIFTLWQNDNALVVGKHQNVFGEINAKFAFENNINIVRRISGGGTVYHDLGNINFTFIRNNKTKTQQVDFKEFTQPIIQYLMGLNLKVEYSKRNDLLYKEKKFSGNAEHVNQKLNRTLHHGTILFNSDIEKLIKSLILNKNYTDKAIKSVSSKVTNIGEFIEPKLTLNEFKQGLFNYYLQHFDGAIEYIITSHDIENINQLVAEKYSTFDWNIGYGPKYSIVVPSFNNSNTPTVLNIEKGVITKVKSNNIVIQNMVGLKHHPNSILEYLTMHNLQSQIWHLF